MAIQFVCPLCGKQTVVADQYAGQTGPCANCGGKITIPNAGFGPPGPTSAPSSSGGGSTMFVVLAVVGVMGLVCCGGVGALFFLGRSQMQVTSKRMQSTNNLKQIGIALHNYHDTHGALPPAVVTDKDGKPLYSGRVLLLPFLEQAALYERFDKSKAWDSPENAPFTQIAIPVFQDPASQSHAPDRSDYVFASGAGTLFDGANKVSFNNVTDGLSNTIAVVATSAGADHWAAPSDWNIDSGAVPPSNHPGKLLVLFADGSVRMINPQYFQTNMRALTSRNAGDILPPEP
jgi:Protein of unknown function (DUF1559)